MSDWGLTYYTNCTELWIKSINQTFFHLFSNMMMAELVVSHYTDIPQSVSDTQCLYGVVEILWTNKWLFLMEQLLGLAQALTFCSIGETELNRVSIWAAQGSGFYCSLIIVRDSLLQDAELLHHLWQRWRLCAYLLSLLPDILLLPTFHLTVFPVKPPPPVHSNCTSSSPQSPLLSVFPHPPGRSLDQHCCSNGSQHRNIQKK